MQKQNFEDGSAVLLDSAEAVLVEKYRGINRLQCVVLLKFFQAQGRFPSDFDDLYRFFGPEIGGIGSYDPQNGTSIRQRADIRKFLGFRPVKTEDYEHVQGWLCSKAIQEPNDKGAYDYVRHWFRDRKIELPASGQIDRIVNSSLSSFEDHLFQKIAAGLPDHSKQAIDQLFIPVNGEEMQGSTAPFSVLKERPRKTKPGQHFWKNYPSCWQSTT